MQPWVEWGWEGLALRQCLPVEASWPGHLVFMTGSDRASDPFLIIAGWGTAMTCCASAGPAASVAQVRQQTDADNGDGAFLHCNGARYQQLAWALSPSSEHPSGCLLPFCGNQELSLPVAWPLYMLPGVC